MIITNVTNAYLRVQSATIEALITDPEDYTSIYLEGNRDCTHKTTPEAALIDVSDLITNNVFQVSGKDIYIKPSFFGLKHIVDGIYSLKIRILKTNNSFTVENNCSFIDILTRCKVAGTLRGLLKDIKNPNKEKVATVIQNLHYALVNGGNCNCNCSELCVAYDNLKHWLNQNINNCLDCGC